MNVQANEILPSDTNLDIQKLDKECDGGNFGSCNVLGNMYDGEGVRQDYPTTKELWQGM